MHMFMLNTIFISESALVEMGGLSTIPQLITQHLLNVIHRDVMHLNASLLYTLKRI